MVRCDLTLRWQKTKVNGAYRDLLVGPTDRSELIDGLEVICSENSSLKFTSHWEVHNLGGWASSKQMDAGLARIFRRSGGV